MAVGYLTLRPLVTLQNYSWLKQPETILPLEGLCQLKNGMAQHNSSTIAAFLLLVHFPDSLYLSGSS
jgi:hypothetical protein